MFSHTEREHEAVEKMGEDHFGCLVSCGRRAHAVA